MITEESQEEAKVSGVELDSDVLANKCDMPEEKEEEGFATEELDVSDETGSLAINMNPNLKQDDRNKHAHEATIIDNPQDHFSGSNLSFACQKVNVTFNKNSQEEAKVSGLELDSDVLANKSDLSEEKVDGIWNDVNQESRNIVVCANLDASKECNLKKCPPSNEAEYSIKNTDNSIGSYTGVATYANSVENPIVQSCVKPPFEVDVLVDEESMPAGSCNFLMTSACAEVSQDSKAFSEAGELNNDLMHEDLPPVTVEDEVKTKSENPVSLESNMCSPSKVSDVQSSYVEGSEKPDSVFDTSGMGEGSSIDDVSANMANTCSSAELLAGNTDLVATLKAHSGNSNDKEESPAAMYSGSVQPQVNDDIRSPEQDGGKCIHHDVSFHEGGSAKLLVDMDIASLDSQKIVESISFAEGCKAQGSEADITILVEPGYVDANFPHIFGGMSSGHHDNEEKGEEEFVSDGTCENGSPKAASSMVDHASLSVVETGASPDSAGEVVPETSVDNMNAVMKELAQEAKSDVFGGCSTPLTVDPIPCDSSAKVGDNVEAGGGIQESILGHHVNMSSEQHASSDMVLISKCNDSHVKHEEDSFFSINKDQSVSPLSNTNNCELSHSTGVKPSECTVNENVSLPEATEDPVLTSEFDHSHTRHEEDRSVSMDKLQPVSLLLDTNNTELPQSTGVKPSEGAINENPSLPEATEDVVSEFDDGHMRHEEDSSVSMDKLQSVSSLLNTNNTELSQSTRVNPSLPEATEQLQGEEHSISLNSDLKIDKSFTFEVTATAGLGETGKGLQLFPASQACNLSTNMEAPCIDSSSSTLDPRKPKEAHVTPQTPASGTIHATGVKERKRKRKSVAKESVKNGKETTTIQSGRVEKLSPLLVSPPPPTAAEAAGHVIQFQELWPKENVECSVTKAIPISNLPDLNDETCIHHQPFTDNQQFQLRAQILVYGSLISGTAPEEPHMIAAFGQSDVGRKTWEAAWHACLERVHCEKSQANTPAMQQPQSDLKDIGYRSPDLGIKHSSILSSSNKGTPTPVSPLIAVSSPLWNMSTPYRVGFQSRSAAFQQPFTPIHPPTYQTPPNPLWLSPGPSLGHWGIASSPPSATSRFSGLPITESVKLTPVKVSGGGPHTYSMPVVDSSVFSSLPTVGKKTSNESKSRKRKKVTTAASSDSSQVLTPPIAHLVPRAGGHNHSYIPFLVENQTDFVTAPVVTSTFSTSVNVSTPPASKSGSPGRFLSVHDHPRLGDKKVGNAEDMLLKNVEEGNVQEADVNATKTWQPSSDLRSLKRTKVTAIPAVNQTPVSTPAPPAVTYLSQVSGMEISLLPQNQTISVTAPMFCTSFPASVAMSTPASITSASSPTGRFLETTYPSASTHGYPRTGYRNMENALAIEETLSKVIESKLQAENAAEVSNCQDVLSRLDGQKNSGVVSDSEAKLMSSMAAATVAKMASAAAKLALNVAEQAKLMADEVILSSKPENFDHILHPNHISKGTPASILKSVGRTTDNHPNSIISAAREAARRRIEAALAASKHAENLDAIVKAAELAAEAVIQVGKIVVTQDSSALRKLTEAGPEGFWKIPQLAYEHHQGGEVSRLHLNNNSGIKNVAPVHLSHNQMVITDSPTTGNEKDTRTSKIPNFSKSVGVSTETNTGSLHTYVVGHIPQNTTCIWESHNIKEGCLVEVYKEDGKYKGAWLAANVLCLKEEKALVCYTGIQSSDEGSEEVKEWLAFKVEGSEVVPRIRVAHPLTTMQFEGARKRRRTAVTDYAWSKGDRVDVWIQNCWREGVVLEPNKSDATSLTVQFPAAQGETLVVPSWNVRPALIWKDRKWIEWNGCDASQGDMPKEKRIKLGSPAAVNDKRKDTLPAILETGRHEEQAKLLPLLSAQESCFNVGKSTNKHSSNLRTIQNERARVVFGVPKPGKKQKFMDVSAQYGDDRSDKNTMKNGSFKFSKPPDARGSKNDATENQVTETKSRLKSRKPPVPSFRTVTSHDSQLTVPDSVENSSGHQNQTQVGSSSNRSRDPAKVPASKKAFTFISNSNSERFNRGKLQPAPKIEVKDKSNSQVNEPRRSNRKIQPTSRLLEGLQSSLTISKIPSISHSGQRKVTPKGNTNHC